MLDHSAARVLLTLHPKVGRWLQLGGHCERGDVTLAGAARREAVEESGITDLPDPLGPVQLDAHRVRCGPTGASLHLDVQYVVVAAAGVREAASPESAALAWWPVDALPAGVDSSVRALVSRALLVVDG